MRWAKWLLETWGVFDAWLDGASLCDPTAGEGVFALALLKEAQERKIALTYEMLSRLHVIERKQTYLDSFLTRAKQEYNVEVPEASVHCSDVILNTPSCSFNILLGNPPWANFTDLPADYKELLKPYFCEAGLVPDRQAILLGSSRVDIAALVLKIVISRLLKDGGSAHFFAPLSLFTGDGAHTGFRDYRAFDSDFSVTKVFEFRKTKIFHGIGTAYCCASFLKGKKQSFPVQYFRELDRSWEEKKAFPLKSLSDPWRILSPDEKENREGRINLPIGPEQRPRQGANSCGANNVFIFDTYPAFLDGRYIFPLASKETWRTVNAGPSKWIFLPYDLHSGRPLEQELIRNLQGYEYLKSNREKLQGRRGRFINSLIDRGYWWSLLGVGRYSFAPYKVMWEAYGKSEFNPIILSNIDGQVWQGNQSMHAFIPCWDASDAERIATGLSNPAISLLLKQLNGNGKCNWAQPGKIKKILALEGHEDIQATTF